MTLYSHQQKIIDDDPKKCGLFLGTGSGKTRIALLLATGKTLVICPKTQKEDKNWQRELSSIKNHTRLRELVVMSKEAFRRDHLTLPRFDTVIVDEAHTCLGVSPNVRWRNRAKIPKCSQLFEALDLYVRTARPDRLYLCTATIIKSPMTVWGAFKVLDRLNGDMMRSFEGFRDRYYTQLPMPGRAVYAPRRDSETKDSLAKLVRAIGYTGRLEDYFDVPTQSFRTVYVELTKAQKLRVAELELEYPDPLVLIGKRHQVENGILSGDEFSPGESFPNEKLQKIGEFALEFPKIVIFAKYRAQIDQIHAYLEAEGYRIFILTGDTKDRGTLLREANNASQCIFVAQAQISAGWELPEYSVMVFASRTYSYVDYAQALGRILRANRLKKNLYINLVVKGGIDEAVDKSLANKQDFDDRIYAEKNL